MTTASESKRLDTPSFTLKTFTDARNLLEEEINTLSDSIAEMNALSEIYSHLHKMQQCLLDDKARDYINQEKFDKMADGFYQLINAIMPTNLNPEGVNQANIFLKNECKYNTKIFTMYTLLGAVVGACLVAMGVGISVLTSGIGLPVGIWLANIGGGLLVGTIFGSKIPQFKTSRAISNLTDMAENYLESKGCKVPSCWTRFFCTPAAPTLEEDLSVQTVAPLLK